MGRARGEDPAPLDPAPLVALVAALLAYVASHGGALPVLRYLPLDGAWALDPPPGALGMGYYGLLLNGALAGAAGWLAARWPPAARVLARPAAARGLVLAAAVVVLAVLGYILAAELRAGGHVPS